MHGNVPWRGAREQGHDCLQFLIEALTRLGDVVLDAYASTGNILFWPNISYFEFCFHHQ